MRIDLPLQSTQELTIRFPDGEPQKPGDSDWTHGTETDIKLSLIGLESTAVRTVARRLNKENLGKNTTGTPNIEDLERVNVGVLAACIVGWSGVENAEGPVTHSYDKAVEFLLKAEHTFIREQVETFVSKRANFFRRSDKAA